MEQLKLAAGFRAYAKNNIELEKEKRMKQSVGKFVVHAVLVVLFFTVFIAACGIDSASANQNATFGTRDVDNSGTTDINIGWSTGIVNKGSHSVHVDTSGVTTEDYATVGTEADFELNASTTISYWGYTVSGSNVDAPDELFLMLDTNDDGDTDVVLGYTYSGGSVGTWVQFRFNGTTGPLIGWYTVNETGFTRPVNITDYYGNKTIDVALGAGSPTSGGAKVDVYLDNLTVNGNTLLDDDTGFIEVHYGRILGIVVAISIQDAINAALPGDTIVVYNGSYTENVNVNKRVTLRGEGADVVTVTAADSNDHVFDVTADLVNISGFNVTGATYAWKAGIYLDERQHCSISDINALNNDLGILVYKSSNNLLTNNTANSNNRYGIRLYSSSNNSLTNNTANSNGLCGIDLYSSSNNNKFTNNTVSSNTNYGFYSNADSRNNTVEDLRLSSYPTTVSFTYDNGVGLKGVDTAPGDPTGKVNISKYVNATNVTESSWLFLNVCYNESDLGDVAEASLRLWRYNGSDWTVVTGTNGVNTAEKYVYANITGFSVFAPLGDAATYIPPTPINLANETGSYWVNYTWAANATAGNNVTDGYNVSNGTSWVYNGTNTWYNDTVGPSGWLNITVWAYNASGGGTLSVGSVSDEVQAPAAPSNWTFIVYLGADNNLEGAGIDDFGEMSSVGSTNDVNIVVQFDRIPGYDSSYDDWVTCKRFPVTPGMTPTAANATEDLGECNMGDPDTLTEFVNWTMTNYPADNYALILWNHGSGWKRWAPWSHDRGVCWDDTNNDHLTLQETEQALTGNYVALLGYDACLMHMIEVVYQAMANAGISVGSEEVEPGNGWPYNTILADLTGTPTMTSHTLGSTIVQRYIDSYALATYHTQSAVDNADLPGLVTAVDNLAQALINELPAHKAQIQQARTAVEYSYWNDNYIDLYHFAELIQTHVPCATPEAQAVIDTLSTAVYADAHGTSHPNFHGLSIYYPRVEADYLTSYGNTNFANDSNWDEFLNRYYMNINIEVNKTVRDPKTGNWEKVIHANVSDELQFRIWVHNNGTENLTNITVNDTLSAGLEYVAGSAKVNGVSCECGLVVWANRLVWYYDVSNSCTAPFKNLSCGQNITIEFNATKNQTGDDTNCVNVSAWCNDTGPDVQVFDDDCVVVLSYGAVHLAVRGTDNGVWYINRNASGSWTGWVLVQNGYTYNSPALTTTADGYVHIAVRGTAGGVWYNNKNTSGNWAVWEHVQSVYTTDSPVLTSTTDDAVHVAVRGLDGCVWYINRNASGFWTGWQHVQSGYTQNSPAFVSTSDGAVHLSVRGLDGGVWYNSRNTSGNWNGWEHVQSGYTPDTPALTSTTDGAVHIAVRGLDGGVWYNSRDPSSGNWIGWGLVQSGYTTDSPVLTSTTDGAVHIAVRGLDDGTWYNSRDPSSSNWGGWEHVQSGYTPDSPALASTSDGVFHLSVRGTDNGVWYNGNPSSGSWTGWELVQSGYMYSSPALTSI